MRLWLAILLVCPASSVHAVVLYDAALGTTPNSQGWTALSNPIFAQARHEVVDGIFTLNSIEAISEQAGYFSQVPALSLAHPRSPILGPEEHSYAIDFRLKLANGIDQPDTDVRYPGQRNRGGFSVIAIGQMLTGIELQFQTDHIVALDNADSAFPIGEAAEIDTTNQFRGYRLLLDKAGYEVWADQSLLLSGALRDYSAIAPGPPFDFPYTTPSFFFLGDNTARGGAITKLTQFSVARHGDCSHNDFLDASDLVCVSTIAERDEVLRALGTLPGDLDGDGEVGFADFLVLSRNFTSGTSAHDAAYSQGNIDLQDGVGFADFLVLSANFGKTRPQVVGLPEPSGTWLGVLVVFLCGTRRPQRKTPRSEAGRFV